MRFAFENIIPHAFGNHQNCGSFFTKTEKNEHVYRYFKDGQCLTDLNIKNKLEKIIQPFINHSAQIAPCSSRQSNESFNNIVCSKHPKSAFYGGSESHAYRVGLAVCQKNRGCEFVVHLNIILNLSPEKHTERFRKRKRELFKKEAAKKKTISAKKRRLILKKKDLQKIQLALIVMVSLISLK